MNCGTLEIVLIYIPIWLDLLYSLSSLFRLSFIDLHSNMVRFIIYYTFIRYMYYISIYIPIWLDLLWDAEAVIYEVWEDLHSNMVRFIIF